MSEYFESLNYTLSNEDSRIEYALCSENLEAVFCIGGSGARVLPLVARNPRTLDVCDLSAEQLALVELRIQAARALTRDEFLFLLGYRGGLPGDTNVGDDRLALFNRVELSIETKRFWLEREKAWRPRGFILLGRWKVTFKRWE